MNVVAYDHVQLSIPAGSEERADSFYVGTLGFEIESKPPVLAARGGRWYRSGGVRLHVGVEADFRPARRAHPALAVDDIDALAAGLHRKGLEVEWDENIPGTRRFYVSDPFGNRLEFVASP